MSNENHTDEIVSLIPETLELLLQEITPSVYESLRTAVEIGKWEDGNKLSAEQLENCMQAVILYEAENIPEDDRTGALLNSSCPSKLKH
ncbi:MAG TPA: DUF1315 domain-containing protein [Gammaproteobacteria bacterium]|nr:DUF1315 domain-containing protein [Gammaproteobacteria bacterium]